MGKTSFFLDCKEVVDLDYELFARCGIYSHHIHTACHNPFLGYSSNSFFSSKKKEKKTQNNVVLNGTVLLLPLDVQQGKRRFSPLQRPFLSLS
jgi:hypothetical protein